MKFKIKSNLWTGIIMGVISIILLICIPSQIRIPGYDSGAPSPRIIPTICLIVMLVFSIVLIIQSLVFKKEDIVEFDLNKELPAIILIAMLCVYVPLIIYLGFVLASVIVFPCLLFFIGERKPSVYLVAIVFAFIIYFLFKYVFNVSLPAGPIFGMLGL